MEFSKVNYRPPNKKEIEAQEEEKIQIATASKNISFFILRISDLCFDKCINLNLKYLSKYENNCINSCFKKYVETNEFAYKKFYNIAMYKGDESDNYDNLDELWKYFFTKASIDANRKRKENKH